MIRACRIVLSVAVLGCYAAAQTQTLSEPYKKWLDCDVSWLISKAEVGHDFFLKISFHGTPVVGTRVSLHPVLSTEGGIVATAKTSSRGVARFKAIPLGTYDPDSPDGVLFPSGDLLIDVKAGRPSGEKLELDWPNHSIATRGLLGKFTVSEDLSSPAIPLRDAIIELRELYSAKLIETVYPDANGDYQFSTTAPGLYALRLVLPNKRQAGFENRDLAVELDPSAEDHSIPEMKIVQSDCDGIQLFGRSAADDRWEPQ